MAMANSNEDDDIPLNDTGDDAVRTEDDLTEDEILTELNKTENDNSYVLQVSRILGPSRHGISEPHIAKGDARLMMPTIYETLRNVTKPGEIGNYRLRITKNGRFWRKFDVSVERAPEDTKPVATDRHEVASLLATFQQNQDRMMQMIEHRLAQQPQVAAPALDPFASLEKLTTIIKNMMPSPVAVQPTNNAKELFEAFKSGIDAVSNIASGDKETGIMDVVQSLLNSPVVAQAIAAATAGVSQPMPAPAPRQALTSQPSQAKPQQPPQGQQQAPPQMTTQQIVAMFSQSPQLQAQAKSACDYLVSLAQRNGDIQTYAFWVCDNWERRFIDLLLNQKEWFQLVCVVSPEAQGYSKWFHELVAEIREVIKDADDKIRASANGHAHDAASAFDADGDTGRESGSENDAEMDGELS
jgi:hypothetical protein